MKTSPNDNLAVLIDADNAQASPIHELLEEVSRYGTASVKRAYGDWSTPQLRKWKEELHTHAIKPVQQFSYTKGKNATDSALIIDAMDLLHSGDLNGFCLVSSDSDFTALANRLRENGLMVVGIGEKKAPEALRNVCNRFIFIENVGGEAEKETVRKSDPETLNDAFQLIANAMEKIDQEGDWFDLGPIGKTILTVHPDFDTRSYGHSKLSALVKAIPRLETKREGTMLMVRRRD